MSFPGLPALPPDVASLFSDVVLLASDALGIGVAAQPQWGIFLNGQSVVLADNVVSVDYRQDFHISTFAIQKGAFGSYNKVQSPFDLRLQFSRGGSSSDRAEFLASIAAIIGDTNLYTVATPEAVYPSVNVVHQDYNKKASKNLGLAVVDVWLEEVRSATLTSSSSTAQGTPTTTNRSPSDVSITFRNPQNPAAASQVNGGNVQPQDPTASQQTAFSQRFTGEG